MTNRVNGSHNGNNNINIDPLAPITYKPVSDQSMLPRKRSQISGACSNLVNSIVGAGIIGIPFALQQSGLVSGIVLLLVVGFLTDKSLRMMVDLATSSPLLKGRGVWTYDDLLRLPFGPKGRQFVLCSMFVTAYGAMVAYLLIIKDTLPVVWGLVDDGDASVGGFVERELIMLVTSVCVVVPLSMQRDFSSLSFTSTISVVADLLLVAFVAVYSPIGESLAQNGGLSSVVQNSIIHPGFFIGFGVLTVAMCCQHSAFIVAASLDNPTPKRWSVVTAFSLSVSVVSCLILGVAGYLGFLDETSGDVLNNFGLTSSANFARALLALTMFFTYPMEAFVARHVLVQLFWNGDLDGYTLEMTVDPTTGAETTTERKMTRCGCLNRRHQVTLLIYVLTLLPALVLDDLGPVLSITGSIGGCCLAYIGPGLAYIGVFGEDFLERLARSLEASNPAAADAARSETSTGAQLPIDGDAKAQLEVDPQRTLAFCPRKLFDENLCRVYRKPWWWFPLGIPLWIRIAQTGSKGMHDRLAALDAEFQRSVTPVETESRSFNYDDLSNDSNIVSRRRSIDIEDDDDSPPEAEQAPQLQPHLLPLPLPLPLPHDGLPLVDASLTNYGFAIFFIVFGVIALVAGVTSNVYVQMNGIFAIPA